MSKYRMKFNPSRGIKLYTEVKTIGVYEDKRRVVARIAWELIFPGYMSDYIPSTCYEGEITGVAVCAEKDTFNPTIGEKVARTKAENKAYIKAMEICQKVNVGLTENMHIIASKLTDFAMKGRRCLDHNIDYIERITA